MKSINQEQIVHAVFQAVEGEGYLPVGEPVTLEHLSEDDNGIFETPASWRGFVYGNFAEHCDNGYHWLSGKCKASTIKKWCYKLEQYADKFVTKVGADKYLPVDKDDLTFEFMFDANNFKRNSNSKICSSVEIFVTASIK